MNLLIGALSGWKMHERRRRCLESWMRDGEALSVRSVFLLGSPGAEAELLGPHALALPCPDDYASLPQRTMHFCRWAIGEQRSEVGDQRSESRPLTSDLRPPTWDYLFKCDDDTYVSIPRLLSYDPEGRDYIGAEWQAGVGYGSGGGGYLLSRKAAAIVAAQLNAATGAEDLLVGRVLREAGVSFCIEPRFVPWANDEKRPRRDNDLITAHGCSGEVFLASHAETGLGR